MCFTPELTNSSSTLPAMCWQNSSLMPCEQDLCCSIEKSVTQKVLEGLTKMFRKDAYVTLEEHSCKFLLQKTSFEKA